MRTLLGHDKDFMPGLLSLGIAIGAENDVSFIEPYLDQVEYVQFMGIRTIGHQGEPFDPSVIPRIRAFRKKHPEMEVTVDGGVTLQNAASLLDAGVSRLVVGSALWKAPDIAARYREFDALTEQYGIYG
jgi:ribulose-phosphate 3-epimerase